MPASLSWNPADIMCMASHRAGRPWRGATCGGERIGDSRFEVGELHSRMLKLQCLGHTSFCAAMCSACTAYRAGGKLAKRRITAAYKSGGLMRTTVRITNNHWG